MPRMNHFFCRALVPSILLSTLLTRAEVRLPAVFSDNMVLQREKPIAVWGWADNGEEVTVSLGSSQTKIRATDGKWKIYLPKQKAGGPLELAVKGRNEVRFHNVLIGEVWICSGQSNMEWPLQRAFEG